MTQDITLSAQAARNAHYMTDLTVEGGKIQLQWYAQVALIGRLVSYIVYSFSSQAAVEALKTSLTGFIQAERGKVDGQSPVSFYARCGRER
jgi:hypothetical protein